MSLCKGEEGGKEEGGRGGGREGRKGRKGGGREGRKGGRGGGGGERRGIRYGAVCLHQYANTCTHDWNRRKRTITLVCHSPTHPQLGSEMKTVK